MVNEHYRPDIQGLRAVAVLLVLFYHAGFTFIPGGYVGVDVFYVISGYLITGLLLREVEQTGTVAIGAFYARRIRRLIPAATVVIVTTLGIAWALYSPLELGPIASSALFASLYVSNIWFARQSTDYLADRADANPLLHTWSLSVEEQFFAVWPLLVIALTRLGPAELRRRRLLICMVGVCAVSLASSVAVTYLNQPWAFFSAPTRAWEFGWGGCIALWTPKPDKPKTASLAGWAGLLLIVATASLFSERTSYPGFAAIAPVLGAGLVIASGRQVRTLGIGRWLGAKPLQRTGDLSYALYLWHWPAFLFMGLTADGASAVDRALGIAGVFGLSWLTVVLIENPVRFSRVLMSRVNASIASGVLLSTCAASLALATWAAAGSGAASESQQRFAAARNDRPIIYVNGCHATVFELDNRECAFGRTSSTVTAVLFGDSHAAQWFPALEVVSEREGWRLISLTKTGCPAVAIPVYLDRLKRRYTECDEWRTRTLKRIETLRPRLIIMASSVRPGIAEGANGQVAEWDDSIRRTLSSFRGLSPTVVLIHDTPALPFSAPICLSRAAWHGTDSSRECTFELPGGSGDALLAVERARLAAFPGGLALDMTDAICSTAPCVVDRDGFVLYSDSHHLTASFSRHLADQLQERIRLVAEMAR